MYNKKISDIAANSKMALKTKKMLEHEEALMVA